MNYFKEIWVPNIHLNTCIALCIALGHTFQNILSIYSKIQDDDFVVAEQPQKNLDDAPQGEDEWEHISNVSVDTDGEHLVWHDPGVGFIFCSFNQVKDIVEEAIEDKLDNNHFPFLGGQRQNSNRAAPTRCVLS